MDSVLTGETMKEWGPHKYMGSDVLIYSLGSLYEGHGPALSPQNDDHVAIRTATQVSEQTGFPYRGHLPFSSDRSGEIAKDWHPAWQELEEVTQGIIDYIKNDPIGFITGVISIAAAIAAMTPSPKDDGIIKKM